MRKTAIQGQSSLKVIRCCANRRAALYDLLLVLTTSNLTSIFNSS